MVKKLHEHNITINDMRRQNKKAHDMQKKAISRRALHQVFNTYYRDQVKALCKAIYGSE
jgi:hypothetical protein